MLHIRMIIVAKIKFNPTSLEGFDQLNMDTFMYWLMIAKIISPIYDHIIKCLFLCVPGTSNDCHLRGTLTSRGASMPAFVRSV